MLYFPKRLLFLDIDGVIVTSRSWNSHPNRDVHTPDTLACEFLKHFCYNQVYKIVISSSWKAHFHMLHKLLWDTGLVHFLVDPTDIKKSSTPYLNPGENVFPRPEHGKEDGICFSRGLEIKKYMDSVGFIFGKDEAIILDDDSFDTHFWDQRDNKIAFIHTDSRNGITYDNMNDMNSFATSNCVGFRTIKSE